MKNSKLFSIKNSPNSRLYLWLVIVFILIAVIGFTDATYLTVKYYTGGSIPCSILNGCDKVTTSRYADITGVPVSLLGAIYYLVIAVSGLLYLDSKNYRSLGIGARLTAAGFLFSIWLVSAQVFILDALCLYCLISAATSTLLFALGIYIIKKYG
ncbi:MAG: vitamin K epoxide reductase family protein [Candidatus Yanofskybacteria bacterium]|nr:vitamin K epoxide reductase family protein [Candidatus Yanofskybacteria bacterium]